MGKFPTEFDGKAYHLQENQTKTWYVVTPNVSEVPPEDQEEMLREMKEVNEEGEMKECELVLNYYSQPGMMHAVYVDRYIKNKKIVKYSAGQIDPYLRVPLKDVLNLYKVTCTAVVATRNNDNNDIVASSVKDVVCEASLSEGASSEEVPLTSASQNALVSLILELSVDHYNVSLRLFSTTSRTVTPWTWTLR